MGTVRTLADEVERGLGEAHPRLRQTVVKKLALAVSAMIEGQTPNTVELANLLPLETERQDRREPWLRRLLKNPLLSVVAVMEPFAREALAKAVRNGQTVLLSLDQTNLGNRMAVLMVALRVGDRALPLAWLAEEGPANIGFEGQRKVLEPVLAWLPAGSDVLLTADRFYPSSSLFAWLEAQGWGYRLRLKGNLLVDPGQGDEVSTGELARVGARCEGTLPARGAAVRARDHHDEPGYPPRGGSPGAVDHRYGRRADAGGGVGLCRALGD